MSYRSVATVLGRVRLSKEIAPLVFVQYRTMFLLDLPEEILSVVLESAILPLDPRLSLPEPQPLLTCRAIHRIGLPILYRSILLRSFPQALKVERTILSQPELVCHIRHLYSSALTSWLPVFHAIGHAKGSLQTLDFEFHVSLGGSQFLCGGGSGGNVWPPLSAVPVRRLVVRQGARFLHDNELVATSALARAIEGWKSLVRNEPCEPSSPRPAAKPLQTKFYRKLPSSNPACCSYPCLTASRPHSRRRCPARLRCAFCAPLCLRSGIRPC